MSEEFDHAIDLVARHLLASLCLAAPGAWRRYPEIGAIDFELVVDRVIELAPFPDHSDYLAAHDVLKDRANRTIA